MIGMGNDKKVGTLLLAIGGGLKPKVEKEDPAASIVNICAERVMECIKEGDVQGFIKELPKLLAILPSAEFGEEEGD
jgi:hypothetical protein